MSMQTLTWDVDAAAVAVAGNSDAYSLALATQAARQKWAPPGIVALFRVLENKTSSSFSADDGVVGW